jgi:hypothetical protein
MTGIRNDYTLGLRELTGFFRISPLATSIQIEMPLPGFIFPSVKR